MDRGQKASQAEQWLYRLQNSCSDEVLQEITQGLLGLNYDKQSKAREQAEVKFLTLEDIAKAKENAKNFGKPIGLGSGYWEIDNMTAGFAPGELIVIGGGTSQGKSLLSANIFARQVMAGHKATFVTLETLADQFYERLLQIMGEEQMNWCALNKTLMVQKEVRIGWESIRYLVENAVNKGAEIVYIDHLHYFSQGVDDDPSTLGLITQECCTAAKEQKVPIVLMSQLNRGAPRGERPRVYDLKGSSYIEQNADIVLGVWQSLEVSEPHIFVGLEKNRNRVIWRPEIAERLFARDGLKILQSQYDFEVDKEFNVTKRFQAEFERAQQMGLLDNAQGKG